MQTKTLVIDPKRTPNAYKEITEYEYDRDKEGNVISGYPDGNDHAISALRYAYEPLFNRRGTVHKMLDRYFSDKINKFLNIGLKIYGSSDINEILKVVEYEDIIVRDTSVRWMDFKR